MIARDTFVHVAGVLATHAIDMMPLRGVLLRELVYDHPTEFGDRIATMARDAYVAALAPGERSLLVRMLGGLLDPTLEEAALALAGAGLQRLTEAMRRSRQPWLVHPRYRPGLWN